MLGKWSSWNLRFSLYSITPPIHYSILNSSSFHPQRFDHVHFSGPPGRDEARADRGDHNHQPGLYQTPDRDGKLNSPSKGLFVNDVNEKDRKEKPADEAENMAEKANHPCLDQGGLLDLPPECTHRPDDSDIPLSFDNQGIQGIDDSKNGHNDGDEFKGISDGKGLVKDLQNLFSQFPMGDHKEAIRLGIPFADDLLEGFQRNPFLEIDAGTVKRLILPQRLEEFSLQQDHSPIRGIIVEDSGDQKLFFTLRGVELDPVSGVRVMFKRETLCDENGLASGKLPENRLRISLRKTNHLHVEKDLSIDRCNQGRLALIFNLQCPERVDGLHSRKRRQCPGDFQGEEGRVTCDRVGTREDEHIPIDRLFHPEVHRLPEAQDHDRDADQHGEGGHQCGDSDHGPGHRIMDISTRQFSFGAKEEAENRSHQTVQESGGRGNQEGDPDDDEERSQKAENGPVSDRFLEGKDERKNEKTRADEIETPATNFNFCFQGSQRQGLFGRNPRGFFCRADRRKNLSEHPHPKACH
jgi:hypothetical protein